MKKYIFITVVLLQIFTSCKYIKRRDCTASYVSVSLKFNNKVANFNEYSSPKLKSKYFRNVTSSNKIPSIVKSRNLQAIINSDNIKATFYVINFDNHQVSDNDDITMDIVDGIVCYNRVNSHFVVSAFSRNNQIFVKKEIPDKKYYSPNQIYDLSTKVFGVEHPIIIAIVSNDINNRN